MCGVNGRSKRPAGFLRALLKVSMRYRMSMAFGKIHKIVVSAALRAAAKKLSTITGMHTCRKCPLLLAVGCIKRAVIPTGHQPAGVALLQTAWCPAWERCDRSNDSGRPLLCCASAPPKPHGRGRVISVPSVPTAHSVPSDEQKRPFSQLGRPGDSSLHAAPSHRNTQAESSRSRTQ